jgi:tRNA-2-methylthio-N6-dimethylallyladenosine synthase
VIVGFPGETDDEYEATLELMRQVRFDGAYMFKYSPRPGTKAAAMEQVDGKLAKQRLDTLIKMQNQITEEINGGLIGREFEVLVEGPSPKNPKNLKGFSRCFRNLHFEGPAELKGQLVTVKATESYVWGLYGEIV